MNHRYLRYPADWEWHVLQLDRADFRDKNIIIEQKDDFPATTSLSAFSTRQMREIQALVKQFPEATDWITHSIERTKSSIKLQQVPAYGLVVHGTLRLQLSEDSKDIALLHFWLSQQKLLTMHSDNRIPLKLQSIEHHTTYHQCETAPEAFFYMIGVLLESLQIGLTQFEDRLSQIELAMRKRNRTDLLDEIIERRYDLIQFQHLFLPIRELDGICKEAFMESLTSTENYLRMQHRFQRIDTLLAHYALEIDTLISVEDSLSNTRGNQIIRTLTIFTVACLPATVIGAIWGSSFDWIPFKANPNGIWYMVAVVLVITLAILLLFWQRGWTGDILQYANNKKSKQLQALERLSASYLSSIEEASQEDEPLPSRRHRNHSKTK